MTAPSLFNPSQLGAIAAPNRIIMATLTRGRAGPGFVPNELAREHYRQRASAGLIISEATGISQEGLGWPSTPGLWTEAQVEGWKPVTDAVHEAGGRIVAQLWHMGRLVHPLFNDGKASVSASATLAEGRAYMPAAGPNVGAQHLNLRSLGPNRTLVLLDGRRVAPSTLAGNVDAALLPQGPVQRVDIVTGGTSAAWGSDAVAGVVNFVLDKTFTGVRLDVEGGVADAGDFRSFKVNLSLGTEFADGRGHILVSGELRDDGASGFVTSRDWYRGHKVINNPAFTSTNGAPRRIVAPDVGYAFATGGGLINGPATIVSNGQTIRNPLLNTQFGPGGVPIAFNPGFSAGSVSMSGDAEDIQAQQPPLCDMATPHFAKGAVRTRCFPRPLGRTLQDRPITQPGNQRRCCSVIRPHWARRPCCLIVFRQTTLASRWTPGSLERSWRSNSSR